MKGIIANQRSLFSLGKTKEITHRIQYLKKLKALCQQNEEILSVAVYKDFQKSAYETYTSEFAMLYAEIDDACKNLSKWAKPKRVRTNLANFPAKSYIISEPLGVCLVIGTWNYPILMALQPAVAALTAGNTVVIKPSEITHHTSTALANIINKNFDTGLLTVVEGGVEATTALLNQKWDKIFFTGSTNVGRIVYEAAAKNLTPVTLELGGKSPAIITESANLKMATKRLIWGKFLNAGQTCIAPDYVLIHQSKEKEFLELAIKEIARAKYTIDNKNYTQIVNDRHWQRLVNLLDESKIVTGGQTNKKDRSIAPTIVNNISFNDAIMQEEIFGPLLPVLTYSDFDQAIAQVKELPKPLACFVFTTNKNEKQKVLSQISFGGGAVNDCVMHITNNKLPFGGVGASGMGAYHGKYGFDSFSHKKSILDKPNWLELNLKYSPYNKKKLKWSKLFFGQK